MFPTKWLAGLLAIAITNPSGITFTAAGTGAVKESLAQKVGERVSVIDFGAKGDGTTDDSAAFVAAIASLTATGGTLYVPKATYKILSTLTLPNSGGGAPTQKSIRIMGDGPSHASSAIGSLTPNGGTILDMQSNSATAKIDTRGTGYLEIDHMTLEDTAADCATFIFTTNTVIHVHDVEFYGTATGTSACNDGIILGGTSTVSDGTASAPFQGYGTVIRDNFFHRLRRVVLGQTYANAIQIRDNAVWTTSGSSTGGAIEFAPSGAGQSVSGNIISGNLIEVTNYKYGVYFRAVAGALGGFNNVIDANGCYDPTATHTACVRFDTGSQFNTVIDGFRNDAYLGIGDADGSNTFITGHQSQGSILSQPQIHTNTALPIQVKTVNAANTAYDILTTSTNDEVFQQLFPSATPQWSLAIKPAGGTAEGLLSIQRNSATATVASLGKAADTNVFLRSPSGADLKLQTLNAGNVLWLCGGSAVCNTYAAGDGSLHNSVATGTAPLVITSTTPVANLTVQNVDSPQFTSVLFAALGTPANFKVVGCSDCTIANPCAGGGTGAIAKRLNGVWVCN